MSKSILSLYDISGRLKKYDDHKHKTKTTPPTLASYKNLTHPAQAEDMQCVRELSSRFVFSRSAAFTLE